MADRYPHTIPIEIDRAGYCRYLRIHSVIGWFVLWTVIGVSVGAFVSTTGDHVNSLTDPSEVNNLVLTGASVGAAAGLLIGVIGYLVRGRRVAERTANALEVAIEGPFLRIADGVWTRCDRRLHFKTIDDYACCQGPLMRWCGISMITLRRDVVANGRALPAIRIPAAKDPIATRDLLSEIDSIRADENPA